MTTLADDLRLALDIADRVDALTRARFGASDLVVEEKPDLTPVSDADKAAEQLIRDALAAGIFQRLAYAARRSGRTQVGPGTERAAPAGHHDHLDRGVALGAI